jgi:hypothetical protein
MGTRDAARYGEQGQQGNNHAAADREVRREIVMVTAESIIRARMNTIVWRRASRLWHSERTLHCSQRAVISLVSVQHDEGKHVRKSAYFASRPSVGWPRPNELERYFLAPFWPALVL